MSASISLESIFLDALRGSLSASATILTDEVDLARHLVDHAPLLARGITPLAVAYPRTTDEISRICRVCTRHGISMTPQGGLTGMVGGAIPTERGLVISMERMNEIEEFDLSASTMTVQAGAALQTVQERADREGLLFPLDLGARGSCQIGGTIATNAGGNRVLRYGMMRDLVLGLEVVLADGTILSSLNKMLKNNTGYDWKQLFIGSEGTLGVVTKAVLRLYPKPSSTNVALVSMGSFEAVLEFLQASRGALSGDLSAFEVMWNDFYSVAVGGSKRRPPLAPGSPFYVLIEALGSDVRNDGPRFERLLEAQLEKGIIEDAVIAQSSKEIQNIWAVRDSSGELDRIFGPAVNFDVSIPTGSIAQFADDARSRLARALDGGDVLVFGHIADSNIHLSCRGPGRELPSKLIEDVVYEAVGDWGGSVSAEHGVGLGKRDYLAYSRTPSELDFMRCIKSSIDPQGLMNPGKILIP